MEDCRANGEEPLMYSQFCYHIQLAEHYGTAIIPARVRTPKDKPNAEGTVGNISTWITAALRNEQFFSLAELNRAIREKLEQFNRRLFQKKEGSHRPVQLSHICGRNAILSSL